jgi:hypothetical protein
MTTAQRPRSLHQSSRVESARVGSQITSNPVVGKDILEVLSSAMYVDPRVVFREYIQNSADAIEDAYDAGILGEDGLGRIDVSIDPAARVITIRDNGIGLRASDAARVLTALGASGKRGAAGRRGFRGIGRFAGMGYAQIVSFRTKAAGEDVSTEIRWDCRKLKAALLDPSYQHGLTQLIRDAVSVHVGREDASASSYFEVRLERVIRVKNDILLNAPEVARYLSETAPVPFHTGFSFAADIKERLEPFVGTPQFRIYLNASAKPITKPFRTEFPVKANKSDTASGVEIHELPDNEGGTAALVWVLHHGYLGAIHGSPEMRGLRARIGDMQIGDDSIFADAFREQRFNSWTIGEVHVLDPRIIPNARRDGFEQNGAYSDLLARLVPLARSITLHCRASSARRYRLRAFTRLVEQSRELLDVLRSRAVSKQRESRTRAELERKLHELAKLAESRDLSTEERTSLARKTAKLRSAAKLAKSTDNSKLIPSDVLPLYHDVIEIISEFSPSKTLAQNIIGRITHRFRLETLKRK